MYLRGYIGVSLATCITAYLIALRFLGYEVVDVALVWIFTVASMIVLGYARLLTSTGRRTGSMIASAIAGVMSGFVGLIFLLYLPLQKLGLPCLAGSPEEAVGKLIVLVIAWVVGLIVGWIIVTYVYPKGVVAR